MSKKILLNAEDFWDAVTNPNTLPQASFFSECGVWSFYSLDDGILYALCTPDGTCELSWDSKEEFLNDSHFNKQMFEMIL